MNEQELERRKKWSHLKDTGRDPYSIEKVVCNSTVQDAFLSCQAYLGDPEKLEQTNKSFIGRIISIRQSFATIKEGEFTLQIYVSHSKCSPDVADAFVKCLDIGDVVYVEGNFFKTKLGELTLRVKNLQIVSKCLNPFPSAHYGIKDEELKVRNRVGRCLVDQDFYDTLVLRSKLIFGIREYLNGNGYLEMETPILDTVYGGANAVPFVTNCEALKEKFFLRIATEISLKKAVISGFHKVYEIGKVFRNEGIDSTHNPEFTSIEIYTANYGLDDVMNLTENIIQHLAVKLGKEEVNIEGHPTNLMKPFRRVFMNDLVKEKTGMDFYFGNPSLEEAMAMAQKHGIELQEFEKTVGHIFHALFDNLISDELLEPTFIYGFHKDVSPLSKTDPKNPNFVLRYELYIGGVEYSNGFAELNDPDDQRERFEHQYQERINGNTEAFDIDEGYLFALQYGLPPTGGIGIGIDRLVMMFANKNSIKDVLFLAHIKNK